MVYVCSLVPTFCSKRIQQKGPLKPMEVYSHKYPQLLDGPACSEGLLDPYSAQMGDKASEKTSMHQSACLSQGISTGKCDVSVMCQQCQRPSSISRPRSWHMPESHHHGPHLRPGYSTQPLHPLEDVHGLCSRSCQRKTNLGHCCHSQCHHSQCGDLEKCTEQEQEQKKHKETLWNLTEPLNSKRLKPMRQRTKNAILSILQDSEVCVEFLKTRHGIEKVVDVCRISEDGLRVMSNKYRCNNFEFF